MGEAEDKERGLSGRVRVRVRIRLKTEHSNPQYDEPNAFIYYGTPGIPPTPLSFCRKVLKRQHMSRSQAGNSLSQAREETNGFLYESYKLPCLFFQWVSAPGIFFINSVQPKK